MVRKFDGKAPLEALNAFVECNNILRSAEDSVPASKPEGYQHEFGFRLVSPMPRTVYDFSSNQTIGECIGRSGNIIVESTDGDDDED